MLTKSQNVPASTVVTVSFLVDLLDVLLSLMVTILSGSVIMLSQVFEGVSDLISSGLLLVGIARAGQKADKTHPFGFGRELYFWALLSGIVTLAVSATLSIVFGWRRFINPEHISNINLAFLVLIFTAITNSWAFYLSFKRLLRNRPSRDILIIFLHSSRIETKVTLVLDLMGAAASTIGIIALIVYKITNDYRYDGLGAILIGVVLAFLAFLLVVGIADLIVGKSASAEVEEKIIKATLKNPKVHKVMSLKTLHIGSEKLSVNLEVHLQHDLTAGEIEKLIDKIKDDVRKEIPEVKHIYVELETPIDDTRHLIGV